MTWKQNNSECWSQFHVNQVTMIEQYDSEITIFQQDRSSQRIPEMFILDLFSFSFRSLTNSKFRLFYLQKLICICYTSVSSIMIMKYCDLSFFEIFLTDDVTLIHLSISKITSNQKNDLIVRCFNTYIHSSRKTMNSQLDVISVNDENQTAIQISTLDFQNQWSSYKNVFWLRIIWRSTHPRISNSHTERSSNVISKHFHSKMKKYNLCIDNTCRKMIYVKMLKVSKISTRCENISFKNEKRTIYVSLTSWFVQQDDICKHVEKASGQLNQNRLCIMYSTFSRII